MTEASTLTSGRSSTATPSLQQVARPPTLSVSGLGTGLGWRAARLLERMLCPLTGLSTRMGFVLRSAAEPRVVCIGGDMTGVHVVRGLPEPREGAYHIGGSGLGREEALLRALGETAERYSEFMSVAAGGLNLRFGRRSELVSEGLSLISPAPRSKHSRDQLARPGFPYVAVDPEIPLGWVEGVSLLNGEARWTPAQEALLGYVRPQGEPRFSNAVTTGTAAHTGLELALRGSLLELIQIDAAMGHWYGAGQALRIGPGKRTAVVSRLVARHLRPGGPRPGFYLLPNADLPGFPVACLLEGRDQPVFAAGLGCDLHLSRAMYKAFIEATSVAQLATVIAFRRRLEGIGDGWDPTRMYDLDTNVAYFAAGPRATVARFTDAPEVAPEDLPADTATDPADDVRMLAGAFRRLGREILFFDLTPPDVRSLGLCVTRVWSPDMLCLSLPSAPPAAHPRFKAYGGDPA